MCSCGQKFGYDGPLTVLSIMDYMDPTMYDSTSQLNEFVPEDDKGINGCFINFKVRNIWEIVLSKFKKQDKDEHSVDGYDESGSNDIYTLRHRVNYVTKYAPMGPFLNYEKCRKKKVPRRHRSGHSWYKSKIRGIKRFEPLTTIYEETEFSE